MELTICSVVDSKTLKQLYYNINNWFMYRPEMQYMKWAIFYDNKTVKADDINFNIPKLNKFPWNHNDYPTQREKMLSAWVFMPPMFVETNWWMKIDTDVHVEHEGAWVQHSWFEHNPVWIAPSWGYTKGYNFINLLEKWGDKVFTEPRLNIKALPEQLRVKHKRMWSPISFYLTEWTRHAAELCPDYKLPVPSQDTYHWYVSAREEQNVMYMNMKQFGWRK